MLTKILFYLLGVRVARTAELLHPVLIDVGYSSGLTRCSDSWDSVFEYYGAAPADEDKADHDKHGFYKLDMEYKSLLSDHKDWCFCAKDNTAAAYWTLMTSSPLSGVQTIVVVTLSMALNFNFKMKTSSTGTTWTTICDPCIIGANDFSAAPLAAFTQIRIEWARNVDATFCNLFIYDKRNYAKDATITTKFESPDPTGYDYTQWSNGKMQGTQAWTQTTVGTYDSQTSTTNTCVNQYNGATSNTATRLSPMMFELPLHLAIYDIFVFTDEYEQESHIVSALNLDANTQTIAQIDTYITATAAWQQDIDKYGGTADTVIAPILRTKKTLNHPCTNSKCQNWNVKRVIITNDNANTKHFFVCGVVILAEPVPCPPAVANCQNIYLQPWSTTASFDMFEMSPGGTIVTDTFKFADTLTNQCMSYSPPAAGCTKTFKLWCNACQNFQANCAGLTLVAYTEASFTWSIGRGANTSVEEYQLTVISSGDMTNIINHRCYIECKLESQIKNSVEFILRETCPDCADTVIAPQTDGSSTPVVGTIPFSQTVQKFNWKWFSDSVRDCGETCSGIDYTTVCRLDTDALFTTELDFTVLLSTTSGTGDYTIQLLANQLTLHQVLYKCKIVGVSLETGNMAETDEFDVMFDACIDPAKSCSYNTWSSLTPAGWTAPKDISVFLDGVTQSSSFDYTEWYDTFYEICGYEVCAAISFEFVDETQTVLTASSFAIQPAVSVSSSGKQITLTVGTTSPSTIGTYKVKVKGTMTLYGGVNDWKGPALSIIWSYFTVNVVDPCDLPNPCDFTTVVTDTYTATSMHAMTAYFDNVQVSQNYVQFTDTVSSMCDFACSGYQLDLVYVADDSVVPTDLALLIKVAGQDSVAVKTKNFKYAGTHTVRIKCAIVQGGAIISYDYSNAFDIILEPCNTKSCLYSTLIALTATDIQPTSYSIGVNNVPGNTDFTPFSNTCGQACTTNKNICGTPTYTTVYKIDKKTVPSFSTTTDASTYIRQSSKTFNLNDAGVHQLITKVQFDMSVYANPSYTPAMQTMYTNPFTVTIDVCKPLPCDYNQILLPGFGETMAEGMYVRTDGVSVSSYFSPYKDEVSMRCSNPYQDLCGPKTYFIEKTDGTAIPGATITISYISSLGLYKVDVSSTDNNAVGLYNTRIRATFSDTSYVNALAESSYEFQIIIDAQYPCTVIQCQLNVLVPILETSTEYLLPGDFVVSTDMKWGFTEYDSWNDTKTEYCRGEPGTKDGIYHTSFLAPVCDWPVYELVDSKTGQPMSAIFGANNIDIRFDYFDLYTSRWKVKVRTNDPKLDGLYDVKLKVRLNKDTNPYYSNEFTIEISDPCTPYICSETVFFPVDKTKPTDIQFTFGAGYQLSTGALWDNTINDMCGSELNILCGPTHLVLMDAATHKQVEFDYMIYQTTTNVIVSVDITDETLIGETIEVYLEGYGQDYATGLQYGTNGTSPIFEITINEPEEVKVVEGLIGAGSVSGPYFASFPPNIKYDKGLDSIDSDYISYQLSAVVKDDTGVVKTIIVKLGQASSFVTYSINNENEIIFKFDLSYASDIGQFPIQVTLINDRGQSLKQTFLISVIETTAFVASEGEVDNKTEDDAAKLEAEKEPLGAYIREITQTGLMTIEYTRDVVPIAADDLSLVTKKQFDIIFEQLSDEIDQTKDFNYTLLAMTPETITVQLHFARPLEVSQGIQKDRVHVRMIYPLFMVEDEDGYYYQWLPGDLMNHTLKTKWIINRIPASNYTEKKNYYNMTEAVPQQVADEEQFQVLSQQISIIQKALSGLFFGPLGLHLFGFGSMDYSWVLYNNLQLMTVVGQFNLKNPQNVKGILKAIAPEVNYQLLDQQKTYNFLKMQGSGNPNYVERGYQQPYQYDNPHEQDCVSEDCNTRRLQQTTTTEVVDTFETSRFYDMGGSDFVVVAGGQLICCLALLVIFALCGFVLQKTFLFWLPLKAKIVFHYLRNRIFWCLPIRLIMQQYAVLTLSSLLNLRYRNHGGTLEDFMNRGASIFILIFTTFGLPTFILIFLKKLPLQYRNPQFLSKFDSIILSVDWNKVKSRGVIAFSLYRKAVLIVVAVNIDLNVLQYAMAVYIQELYVAFIMNFSPMLGVLRNKVEFLNEVVILITIFLQCTLTDYVPDPQIRYNVFGWIIVSLIYFQLLFNSFFLLMSVFHQCKRIYKIFRFHLVMRQRADRIMVHNWQIEQLGQHKSTDELAPYLKETDLAKKYRKNNQNGLDVIDSMGSMEEQSSGLNLNLSIQSVHKSKKLTLSARRRRFQAMMSEMRGEQETDLPTFTQHSLLKLKETQMKENLDQENGLKIDKGEFRDWHALPDEYSNPEKSVVLSFSSAEQLQHDLAPDECDMWLVDEPMKSQRRDALQNSILTEQPSEQEHSQRSAEKTPKQLRTSDPDPGLETKHEANQADSVIDVESQDTYKELSSKRTVTALDISQESSLVSERVKKQVSFAESSHYVSERGDSSYSFPESASQASVTQRSIAAAQEESKQRSEDNSIDQSVFHPPTATLTRHDIDESSDEQATVVNNATERHNKTRDQDSDDTQSIVFQHSARSSDILESERPSSSQKQSLAERSISSQSQVQSVHGADDTRSEAFFTESQRSASSGKGSQLDSARQSSVVSSDQKSQSQSVSESSSVRLSDQSSALQSYRSKQSSKLGSLELSLDTAN